MKIFKVLTILILGVLILSDCRKNTKDDNSGSGAALLLLLANRNTTQSGTTSTNNLATNVSSSSEDSVENGAAGDTSNSSYSTQSGDPNLAVTVSVSGTTGTITVTNEVYPCWRGGTITVNGTQTATVSNRNNYWDKTVTLTNGTRTVTYSDCKPSLYTTISSGTITVTQTTPSSGSTTWVSAVTSGTVSTASTFTGTVQRTLTNLSITSVGTGLVLTTTGLRGTNTYNISFNHSTIITSRVRNWSVTNGILSNPVLVSRSGSITGTTTINGTTYNVNTSLDSNVD